ncbi:DUF748 domain-containing protein [Geobacter anodireducens]|uniref:Flagellar motor protein MotB n=1 Tax=Geobacter soli TaxID=1510391 RepID=A0A0C1TPW7_9BACT|nr:DUF748 domain-containing protein [Geobacter soli]KIE41348.1 flagellar motor protein MotB [Geobacter soli]
MKLWHKVAIGAGACSILLIGFIGLILPGIVKTRAMEGVEAATGRKLLVGDVSINPFTWTVEVRDVSFTEPDKTTVFASFSSARVQVSPASIFRMAPVVREARLSSPHVRLVRVGPNTYNFSDLLGKKKAEPKKDEGLPRVSLNNITIANGSLDFLDQGERIMRRHEVRRLDLGIPFLSTIPYFADRYITPRFSALVNDAPVRAEGKLRPFAKAAEYDLNVDLRDLAIKRFASYIPAELPILVQDGTLSTTLGITYRVAEGKDPDLMVSGSARLAGVKVAEHGDVPLLALAGLEARLNRARVLAGEFPLSLVTLERPEIHLARDAAGTWNLLRLAGKKKAVPAAAEKPAPPGRKPLVSVAEFRLADGAVHLDDRLPAGGFAARVEKIAMTVKGFSTAPGTAADCTLSLATGRGEEARVEGRVTPDPLALTGTVQVAGIDLGAYYPYLSPYLTAPVTGKLDAGADIGFSTPDGVRVDKGRIRLASLRVPFEGKDGARLAEVAGENIAFVQKDATLTVGAVRLRDGEVRFSRNGKGEWSPLTLVRRPGPAQTRPAARPEEGTAAPFRYRIGAVSLAGLTASFTDGTIEDRPTFTLRRIAAGVENLTGPKFGQIPFRFAARYGKEGELRTTGRVRPEPLALNGNVTIRQLPLTDFDYYLPKNLLAILADGTLDTAMAVSLARSGGKLTGSFAGGLGVRSFYLLDGDGEDLLRWESLQLDKVKGSIDPFTLDIREVALNQFYSKIVIDPDGRLNLQKLFTPAPEPAEGAAKPEAVAAAAQPAPAPETPARQRAITIGAVTMQAGTLDFSDRHMPKPYATTFYNLGGRVSGLTSEESKFADVDLRGNLENHSPISITGRINPLRDDLYADIKVRFTDIELSPMTPYSGTYLGYAVDKGKLFLDLQYTIQNKQLNSENKVFIDQLTFGNRIESDKATGLPVRLAVALLKDRKGEIHLDLPVTGRTDDPQFSVWRVVLQILKNLLVKAATSPFALLQSAFGGGADLSVISFGYGSAELAPAEQDKLRKIAQALADRPAIKVEVAGYVERDKDAEGYRSELLRRKVRAEKFLEMVKKKQNKPGDSAEAMAVAPEEYERLLTAVYKKEKFPKPRTIIGTVKELPEAEMTKLILANTVVGDAELKTLADERAAVVRTFLVEQGKLDSARVFQKSGDIFKRPDKQGERGARVEFSATVD